MNLKDVLKKLFTIRILKACLYILCYSFVLYQLHNCIVTYQEQPTSASIEVVSSADLPLAFTFCQIYYNLDRFDGNFDSQLMKNLIALNVHEGNSSFDMIAQMNVTFDFIGVAEKISMCKEVVFPNVKKAKLTLTHNSRKESKNFHLFIHQPGLFLNPEFSLKYDNKKYFHNDIDGSASIKMQAFNMANNPKIDCSESNVYHECLMKETILLFNASYGCTYPIQR